MEDISDKELIDAVNKWSKQTESSIKSLGFDLTYFGPILNRLDLSNISMGFTKCSKEETDETIRHIIDCCGINPDFVYDRDSCYLIRWTTTGVQADTQIRKVVVMYTPILLDKGSKFLLINDNLALDSSFKLLAPRYEMPLFVFNDYSIDKIIIRNSQPDMFGTNIPFNTTLDKLYISLLNKKPDYEIANLDKSGIYRKQDLFLDFRKSNLVDDASDAKVSCMKARQKALLHAARRNISLLSSYLSAQEIKPWLDIYTDDELGLSAAGTEFKSVYLRQKKFDAKVHRIGRGQFLVGSFYNQYIAAMYADAFIHQHWDEVVDPAGKLNFPKYRIPVRCCCPECMTLEKKRGPQPKVDKLHYIDDYRQYLLDRG